ncbi:MBL fold metallo-hydrolase [Chitinophaga sancti]|uniref:L-ascorbate metabolism protein UlaG, beta-lactamase superfamily n=1 Tax=Chitinophaga sancti TaxID=1004 RepID=A0A1K1QXQ5_9BACT|nr:MBL fold metallo-hydrolase [Chitinophaga sancti]WQD62048.1 MBL fold metallo-hydrolase [Chitinophaga sancti]WQG92383.1 MBL fold metallo-hydrolase [Chitinophaga sancti]SFW64565.1 L-ascorbate metabolism protein UlaG, beta-lactamase superfamily [Chitinophaga sancti]
MKLQLLRNATQVLTVNDKQILIDPMLGPKGAYDTIIMTDNGLRNPLVDLPVNPQELIKTIDAVLLTHLHNDHWDSVAVALLPKDIPLFCQAGDEDKIREAGFTNVTPVADEITWQGITISRTSGQHGTGEIGNLMGRVSGYVINDLYIAGDTIWCEDVKNAIDKYQPKHIVLNGGAAQFVKGDPIVMSIDDIRKVRDYAPAAQLIIVHLEAVNHSRQSREQIRTAFPDQNVRVPDDGEFVYI